MDGATSPSAEQVPFLDLVQQHRLLKAELLRVVERALNGARFVGGDVVEQFEGDFARFTGSQCAVGVASGTDALRFALLALGIGPGDTVVTVPNTFVATAAAITQVGATVRFVDVYPHTMLMDPNRLDDFLKAEFRRGASSGRPAAVIPVHLYGQCADMCAITEIARRFQMRVVEDAAQAHGALYQGHPAGSLADAAAFSFYPGKNLGACGEGGAVTTNDSQTAERVRLLRDHGREGKYRHVIEGYNGRLDAIQAGILQVKLQQLPRWNQLRQQHAAYYTRRLSDIPTVHVQHLAAGNLSAHHLYVIRTADRDALQSFLRTRGIGTGIHYPIPLHLQPCYARLSYCPGDFAHAEHACRQVLSLPMFPELTQRQLDHVVESICQFLGSTSLAA